jgi:hypothetical protein
MSVRPKDTDEDTHTSNIAELVIAEYSLATFVAGHVYRVRGI